MSAVIDPAFAASVESAPNADNVARWSKEIDAAAMAELQTLDLESMKVRARIRAAVLARLDVLKPYKLTQRKIAGFLALPPNLALGFRLAAASADAMWRAAGDRSTDFNWYSKRASLMAVIAATDIAWFGDESDDGSVTAAFLDARIENVMQYEAFKARLRRATGYEEKKTP